MTLLKTQTESKRIKTVETLRATRREEYTQLLMEPYIQDHLIWIQKYLVDFPVHDWTNEYILAFTQEIKTEPEHLSMEEYFKKMNRSLYAFFVEHRRLLKKVYTAMVTISGFHRNFLWYQFRELHGATHQDFFMIVYRLLMNHKEQYDATIQKGIVQFSLCRKMEGMNLSSRASTSGLK